MRADLTTFSTGWIGISISLGRDEIDALIARLATIRDNPEHHFHARSDFEGTEGIADIEFWLIGPDERENMFLE